MQFDLTYENIVIWLFNNFWFTMLLVISSGLSMFLFWLFYYRLRPCRVILLRNQGDTYFRLAEKRYNKTATQIRFKKKTFVIHNNLVAYLNTKTPITFIDFDTGKTLTFKKIESLSPQLLDLFLSENIVGQLANRLMGMPLNWVFLIVFLALGIFVGIVLTPYLPIPQTQNTTVKV